MIRFRSFRNPDPPRLLQLWHRCELGRGAAEGFGPDAFEVVNFSQPYFDPRDLILAEDEATGDLAGFVHTGPCANDDESGIDPAGGVICAVLVDPAWRRRGIGRDLVERGVSRLRERGAETVHAGPAYPCDPFYVGVYGGARPSGFLESDPHADPFLKAVGFEPVAAHVVLGRDLEGSSDPINFRLVTVRRRMQLAVGDEEPPTWWWSTRFGRLDTIRFHLVPKRGGEPVAAVTVVGLDLYVPKWNARAVGFVDVRVPEDERRKGYAQALVLEVCRRLREELVTRVEVHVPEKDEASLQLFRSCGFQPVDRGIVYRLKSPGV